MVKSKNKIENEIMDEGCKSIFNVAKYLSNLEILNLDSKRDKH